mmetsp:Transcript_15356/g.53346  ORF Transcript_15356/g.53346 Transcript_15356/m.53346 type:complete len:203 (-) Transcript_15356:518-1126(-)
MMLVAWPCSECSATSRTGRFAADVKYSVARPMASPAHSPAAMHQKASEADDMRAGVGHSGRAQNESGRNQRARPYSVGVSRIVVAHSCVLSTFSMSGAASTDCTCVAMKEQRKQAKMPADETRSGNRSAPHSALRCGEVAATTSAAHDASAKEPNRSLPMPAMSPTLSPTLSAITPGLRWSSSGMPSSTLPTRSAPTSAAFV